MNAEPFDSADPLKWWYTHKDQFPNLYHLAQNILTIPGMIVINACYPCSTQQHLGSAVVVEYIFSGGMNTIEIHRANLNFQGRDYSNSYAI
jgi:hypothetical protein